MNDDDLITFARDQLHRDAGNPIVHVGPVGDEMVTVDLTDWGHPTITRKKLLEAE